MLAALTTGVCAFAAVVVGWRWKAAEARLTRLRQVQEGLQKASEGIEQQRRVLELVAKGESLDGVLEALVKATERMSPGSLCTAMLLDQECRHLHKGAGPSLPPEYMDVADGFEIGPEAGACGAAAFRNETVIVEDVAVDPLFAPVRELLLGFGLRACWSVPIRDSRHHVLGTFAMYHLHPAKPSDEDLLVVEMGAHLAGLAIERLRAGRELQAGAERIRLMERAASFGIWEVDLATLRVTLSEGLVALYGDPDLPRSISLEDLVNLVHPDDREMVRGAMRQAIEAGELLHLEFRYMLAGGGCRWQRCHAQKRVEEGRAVRMIGTSIDITAERELCERLELARAKAEAGTRAKSEFLANMNHEIRTPLNGIIGAIGLLADMGVSREQKEYLETIESCGTALLELVNDVLDLSKADSGRLTFEREPFSLEQLVADSLAVVAPQASARHLELRRAIGSGVPVFVTGDRQRLGQVLLNLLSNAVKFTERGSVTLRVEAVGPVPGGVELDWTVADTGIGIAPEVQQTIFEPFTQADSSTTRCYGGTGLGLAICLRLITAMGGRLEVESEPGRGSTFRFRIPMAVAEGPPPARPAAYDKLRSANRCLRVLLAEDNLVNQRIASRMLERMGHQVDLAGDGRQAVELARANVYDLILMDHQMPVMNGCDAAREIRRLERGAHVPIFAMTASSEPEHRQACLDAGMSAYLVKPVSSARLFDLVEALARQRA
jgi:signal transduction histidine kinase/ActR/RegA family two-component response regulator